MATTMEDLVLKINVEGRAQITETTSNLKNMEAQAKNTGKAMNDAGGNIRNVAFQVQDLAVQIAGGTSAFVALGQQLPQLLGGFGVLGAVIGALAAVSIPLARVGLQAMGFDMRDLNEMTRDLTNSTKDYQDAQRANAPTLKGLGNEFGSLTSAAKEFYQIQEAVFRTKVLNDYETTLRQVTKSFGFLNDEVIAAGRKGAEGAVALFGETFAATPAKLILQAKLLGLSVDQARELGNRLKELDANAPEKNVKIIGDIAKYLEQAGIEGDNFRNIFDNVIDPLLKVNNQILEINRNVKEAAQQATAFNTSMLELQTSFIPKIGDARRSFNQIQAIRLEGALKIAEFEKQIAERSAKDGVDRSAELGAFRTKIAAEILNSEKDIANGQKETYRSQLMSNLAKSKQLDLEKAITELRDQGIFALSETVTYDEKLLRNGKEYEDQLRAIHDLYRKNQITQAQALQLEDEALVLRQKADANARAQMNADIRKRIITEEMDLAKKSIEDQIANQQRLGDAVRSIQDKINQVKTQTLPMDTIGMNQLQRQLFDMNKELKAAEIQARRTFAEGFKDSGDGLSAEQIQQLNDGLIQITNNFALLKQAQTDYVETSYNQSRDWNLGWRTAFAEYADNAYNAAQQSKTYFDTFARGFEDAIVNLVTTGKLSFKDLANSMIAEFARIEAKKMFVYLFGGQTGGGGILGSLFGFGKAGGGPVMAGKPYMVGESGPELFVPNMAGRIEPNYALANGAGQPVTVNYNISAVDAQSFRALVARDPSFIYAVTEQGRRSQPSRRVQ